MNIPIHEHIGKISNFLKFFEIQKLNEEVKCGNFLKYFSSDLIKEVKSQPDFDSQKISIDYLNAEFIKVLELKKSKVSQVLGVFHIIQELDESVINYAKRIRIQAMDVAENKEKIMIQAFIKGLKNQKVAAIVQVLNPETLKAATECIKDEDCTMEDIEDEDATYFRSFHKNNAEIIQSMKIEIETLKKEIQFLKSKLDGNKDYVNSQKYNRQYGTNNEHKDVIKCFKCNKVSHIAKFCKTKKCFNCGGNHLVKFCKSQNNFRYFQTEDDESISTKEENDTEDLIFDCVIDLIAWKQF